MKPVILQFTPLNPILTQISPVHTITAIRSSSALILSSHRPMVTSLVDQFWYQVSYGFCSFIVAATCHVDLILLHFITQVIFG